MKFTSPERGLAVGVAVAIAQPAVGQNLECAALGSSTHAGQSCSAAGLHAAVFDAGLELGHQFGRDQGHVTTFEGFDDTSGSTYRSAGIRGGF